jgi:UDP-glucose:(heptosyl)LPS alpha-1,3-glucosyltransferase
VAWQVVSELLRQGEDVTVFARESTAPPDAAQTTSRPPHAAPNSNSRALSADMPRIQIIPAPRAWQPLRVALFSSRSKKKLLGQGFDVVHGFARTRHQDLYRAGGGSHADYLRRTHSGLALAARRLSPRHRTLLAIERAVFKDPHQRIQCSSRLVADALVEDCGVAPERIFLLPNAVDADLFSSPKAALDGTQLREELGGEAEQVWLLPGSGWHRKGLDTLLRAASALGDPGLHVWVAGRDRIGPWRERATSLGLGSRIQFLGVRSDLPSVYQAVDGVVLPTRYDPFANVTLEAAAAGRPIITTTANGASEWLSEHLEVIPDAEDVDALASALTSFREPTRRRERGERLRKRALDFDWPSHVRRLREEYRRIIESRARGERS